MLSISPAVTEADLKIIRVLFLEYADTLGFKLDFQDFDSDINDLPGKYGPPSGRLLLARWNDEIAGCGALRRFDGDTCEMKRLWVRPPFRGKGIGKEMSKRLISEARAIGYKRMVLDTIDTMTEAMTLYESLGFIKTNAYYHNPIEGATYFSKDLTGD